VRDAEGGETTPSFGHPSNVRRGKGGTAFGAERSEVPKGLLSNLPKSLLIGGRGVVSLLLGGKGGSARPERVLRSEGKRPNKN